MRHLFYFASVAALVLAAVLLVTAGGDRTATVPLSTLQAPTAIGGMLLLEPKVETIECVISPLSNAAFLCGEVTYLGTYFAVIPAEGTPAPVIKAPWRVRNGIVSGK